MIEVEIYDEVITLVQFLKYANAIPSGGIIRAYLEEDKILVNNEIEHRRKRKLIANDIVEIKEIGIYKVVCK